MPLYVMGAGYVRNDPSKPGSPWIEHALVKPSGGNPYVFTYPIGSTYRLCQHHAYLYELSEDYTTARLAESPGVAHGIVAPKVLTLSDKDRQGVIARINGQGADGVYAN